MVTTQFNNESQQAEVSKHGLSIISEIQTISGILRWGHFSEFSEATVATILLTLHHNLATLARMPSPGALPLHKQMVGILDCLLLIPTSISNENPSTIRDVTTSVLAVSRLRWLKPGKPERQILLRFAAYYLRPRFTLELRWRALCACGNLIHDSLKLPVEAIVDVLSSCLLCLQSPSLKSKVSLRVYTSLLQHHQIKQTFTPSVHLDHYRIIERLAVVAGSDWSQDIKKYFKLMQSLVSKAQLGDSQYHPFLRLMDHAHALSTRQVYLPTAIIDRLYGLRAYPKLDFAWIW